VKAPEPLDPAEPVNPPEKAAPVDPYVIDDGAYDVVVLDAIEATDGETMTIEVTIVAGANKGMVIGIHAPIGFGDPIDLMGMPATLRVEHGVPTVRVDL